MNIQETLAKIASTPEMDDDQILAALLAQEPYERMTDDELLAGLPMGAVMLRDTTSDWTCWFTDAGCAVEFIIEDYRLYV